MNAPAGDRFFPRARAIGVGPRSVGLRLFAGRLPSLRNARPLAPRRAYPPCLKSSPRLLKTNSMMKTVAYMPRIHKSVGRAVCQR